MMKRPMGEARALRLAIGALYAVRSDFVFDANLFRSGRLISVETARADKKCTEYESAIEYFVAAETEYRAAHRPPKKGV